jgi:hypothetical protein
MHFSGAPPTAPSTSQYGNRESVHEPSAHDSGLGFVHPTITHSNKTTHRMAASWSFGMRVLSTKTTHSCVKGNRLPT